MEFRREADMARPVQDWLESIGLAVKAEFANPWGVCDFVGCCLRKKSIEERIALGQRAVIGPPQRIALLTRIPDRDTGRSVTLKKLQRDHKGLIDAETISYEIDRLVATRFVQVTSRGSFQKVNGWFPLHQRLVAVELKLSRISEALGQAIANCDLTTESYAAFPVSVAQRIINGKDKSRFKQAGIGVISVAPDGCKVVLVARTKPHLLNSIAQAHCVERFWRQYLKDNLA